MEPIRILYVNGGPLNRGGIESYMMNYYRHIERDKIQIDFISLGLKKSAYDDEIELLGGHIYYLPQKSKNYFGYISGLRRILQSGKYNIVHTHMDAMGITVLKEAKKINIPIRIAHSHNTKHLTNNYIKFLMNEYARINIKKYTTHMFACSELSGRWLFGNKAYDNKKVNIIKNAIDINKFKFDEEKRLKLRKSLNLSSKDIILGHIGRFDYQKNHVFLLNIFSRMIQKNKMIKLILIGDGHLREEIEEKIIELQLQDNVIMLGLIQDTSDYYNIFDVFILPSLFEGLPVVGIEAQANGLPCLFSDSITRELDINENVEFISLDYPDIWIEKIFEKINNKRIIGQEKLIDYGYDINSEAKKLQRKYLLLEGKNESFIYY